MPYPSYRPPLQLDLFEPVASSLLPEVPSWTALPEGTRMTLTSLVTRMLIAHAHGEAVGPESDDERV